MPIDDVAFRGTEKNGAPSSEYCLYCYKDGALIHPETTLDQMKVIVKDALAKQNAPAGTLEMALSTLPYLKRWRRK